MITQDVGIQARQLETGLVLLRVERLQSEGIAARVKEVIGAGQETTFLGAATVIERTRVRTRQIPES